jgi:hypothetical protein
MNWLIDAPRYRATQVPDAAGERSPSRDHGVGRGRPRMAGAADSGKRVVLGRPAQADRDFVDELGEMIANCDDPYLQRELIRRRNDLIETAVDADRTVRDIEAEIRRAVAAPPRVRRPLAIVARRS